MTTESEMNQVGAISRVDEWHSVEWRKVNQNARRLQARTREGDTSEKMEQGKSLAISFNSLTERQTICHSASDGKLWKTNFRR